MSVTAVTSVLWYIFISIACTQLQWATSADARSSVHLGRKGLGEGGLDRFPRLHIVLDLLDLDPNTVVELVREGLLSV